jgi:hypothetical protein
MPRDAGAATARFNAGRVTAELAAPGTSTSPTQLRLAGSSDIDEQLTPETRRLPLHQRTVHFRVQDLLLI